MPAHISLYCNICAPGALAGAYWQRPCFNERIVRILQIIYALSSGGAERLCVELSNELSKRGHEVHLCVVRDLSLAKNSVYLSELLPEVKVTDLKIPEGFSFKYVLALHRTIASIAPDVVHTHLNIIRYLFPVRAFFPGIRFVHTVHNEAPKEVSFRFEFILNKLFFKRKWIHAVTISDATSLSFAKYYGMHPSYQINNGRSRVQKSPRYGEALAYIDSLRKTPSTMILLHVARYAAQKNQPMLVRVVNQLVLEGHDIQLIVLGDGFDSPEGQALKAASCDSIHYRGVCSNAGDYYFGADAFCMSSLHEGMPISLIEAMCCGCTPVCTPAGGCKDLIQHGKNGFLSADCSEKAYYEALRAFLRDHETIDKNVLVDYFNEHLSIELCAGNYLGAYAGEGK